MFRPIGERRDDDARQAVLALQAGHEVLEHGDVEDQAAGGVGHEFAPVCRGGSCEKRLADLEVFGALAVGHDDQPVAVGGHGVFDAVFVAGLASSDEDRRARGVGRIDEMHLARLVVVDHDLDEAVGLGPADGDKEASVGFLVDLDVCVERCAERVAPDRLRAVVFIEADVEQRAAIGGPNDAAARVGDGIGKVLAGCKIAEADRRKLRALVVDGIGEDRVIGAVGGGAELPVGRTLRLDIAVEENCFAIAAPWLAA